MDMSKLPRMSDTQRQQEAHAAAVAQQQQQPQPPSQGVDYRTPPAVSLERSVGAEVWISVILGLVFVYMGWNFARYTIATLTGQTFHTNVTWNTGEKAGQEVAYFELMGGTAYTESGIFLFGVAMLLEAAAMLIFFSGAPMKRALITFALGVTVLALAYNAVVVMILMGMGIFPLMSILAVAFGVYMAVYEWRMLQALNAVEARGGGATM